MRMKMKMKDEEVASGASSLQAPGIRKRLLKGYHRASAALVLELRDRLPKLKDGEYYTTKE